MVNERDEAETREAELTDTELESVTSPSSYKVLGEVQDTDAAGVLGRNTSSSGITYGVFGETESSDSDAVAVCANAPNGGRGLLAESTTNKAVVAESADTAVDANSTARHAILGTTEASGYNGVWGENTANTG
jgi:hypothetical protein